jgi:hypothetical protein
MIKTKTEKACGDNEGYIVLTVDMGDESGQGERMDSSLRVEIMILRINYNK